MPADPEAIGPYRLLARLGEGGMGRVYLGISRSGRLLAVKAVRSELAADPDFRTRFAREVDAARLVSGVFSAPLVDADTGAETPWMATGFVAGGSLREVVERTGPLPAEAAAVLAVGLAEALRAVHSAGLVHRDLKPGNVLLAADGPRIIDFGVARALDAASVTRTGELVGTAAFMSPEQALGRPAGPASDVFSLGGVLHYALTGRAPFPGEGAAVLHGVLHARPDLGALPGPLREAVALCLAKDPAARPTAAGLIARLPRTRPGAAPAWPPPAVAELAAAREREAAHFRTAPARPSPRAARGRRLAAAGAAAAALLLGSAGLTAVLLDRAGADGGGQDRQAGSGGRENHAPEPGPEWAGGMDTSELLASDLFPGNDGTEAETGPVLSVAFDPSDPEVLFSAGLLGADRWDLREEWGGRKQVGEGSFRSIAVSPDGERTAAASTDGALALARADGGGEVVPVAEGSGEAGRGDLPGEPLDRRFPDGLRVAFDPGGEAVTAFGTDGWRRFDAAGGEGLPAPEPAGSGGFALHPEGDRVAVAAEGRVRVLDAETGAERGSFDTGAAGASTVAYSPDGRLIATGGEDRTVRVFDADTHEEVLSGTGHPAPVTALAISPNGEILVSGARDGGPLVWDLSAGERLPDVGTWDDPVHDIAWNSDGTRVALAHENGNVEVWTRP
ncbi:WD40 repeat domain-containing serine/threonine protein kinase [Nocardiopsis composta]